MSEFRGYTHKLLKKATLNSSEKKDLEDEIVEHLISMRDEYIKQGIPEKDSISMAIKNFNASDFLSEIRSFTVSRKLTGLNIKYILNFNMALILIYLILMAINISLFKGYKYSSITYDISYFLIISFILYINYDYSSRNFESKRDIISNVSITCLLFFLAEKISVILLSIIYSKLAPNLIFNVWNSYVFNFNKIIIYLVISISVILMAKYDHNTLPKRNLNISTVDIFILSASLIFSIVYILYPNRFYLLNLIVSKIFNIEVRSFNKNLLHININNNLIIINIGLVIIGGFILYKFISYLLKIHFKRN
ncbi:hypothetical protein [Clostridium polynesiense]|uniref:hypothetical protein n=1 Tax=Clostridium polynesiense TaxID=1325933 RepID=UPI00058D9C78|nr:hypothetical protein [Clostridium polynesiense]